MGSVALCGRRVVQKICMIKKHSDTLDVSVNSPCGQQCAPQFPPEPFHYLSLHPGVPHVAAALPLCPFIFAFGCVGYATFPAVLSLFVCQFVWVAAYVCVRTGVEKASLLCRRLPGFQVYIGFVSFGR